MLSWPEKCSKRCVRRPYMVNRSTQNCTLMTRFIIVVLVNAPIVALLCTVVATTTNPAAFYAGIFYALLVGLSGLASISNKG